MCWASQLVRQNLNVDAARDVDVRLAGKRLRRLKSVWHGQQPRSRGLA
jgi:hypothetical protein